MFPEFEKAGKLVELVAVLRAKHIAGRVLTQNIINLSNLKMLKDTALRSRPVGDLKMFTRMYRPHEAREGSVLYPAFRVLVSPQKFLELGDMFERKEHEVLGSEGFEGQVEYVAGLEKKLGIYELSQFTPKV